MINLKKIFKFQEVSGDLCVCDYNFSGEVPLWCLTHFRLILGQFQADKECVIGCL